MILILRLKSDNYIQLKQYNLILMQQLYSLIYAFYEYSDGTLRSLRSDSKD